VNATCCAGSTFNINQIGDVVLGSLTWGIGCARFERPGMQGGDAQLKREGFDVRVRIVRCFCDSEAFRRGVLETTAFRNRAKGLSCNYKSAIDISCNTRMRYTYQTGTRKHGQKGEILWSKGDLRQRICRASPKCTRRIHVDQITRRGNRVGNVMKIWCPKT
jgi:hypothetical protein